MLALLSAAAMTAYAYAGRPEVWGDLELDLHLGHSWREALSQGYRFAAAAVLLALLPGLVARVGYRIPLRDQGVRLGDWRFGLKFLILGMVALPPLLWLSAGDAAMQAEYPLARIAGHSAAAFLAWEACYLFYYIAWEYHFRGLLQLGLRDELGDWGALLLQTVGSTLLHIGKPWVETSAAVVAGVAFGLVALRTRSLLWVLLLHWYIGVVTDLFCLLRS